MVQRKIPAVFMRGGTSRGLMFHRRDLPDDETQWGPLFLRVMGSPDPNRRQLDGMGGGVSSTSKVCVIAPASRTDADVDYTFAQIGVHEATVDYAGNCGNMSAAVGPFAVDEGLVELTDPLCATVRIHNTNTGKIIVSRFGLDTGESAISGDAAVDGVTGTGAPIRLEFTDPAGSKTGQLLPSRRSVDRLQISGIGEVEASLVDATNPCVFVYASALGLDGTEMPTEIDANYDLLRKLEAIRLAASTAMGIAPTPLREAPIASIPKIALISQPKPCHTLSNRRLTDNDMDINIRMLSMGQTHRAVPLTGALCLAVACRVPGTLAQRLMTPASALTLRIGHPSGVIKVEAKVSKSDQPQRARVDYVAVERTSRRLFEGFVRCPIEHLSVGQC